MSDLLSEILASTRAQVARIDDARRVELEELAERRHDSKDFAGALTPAHGNVAVIAEIKRRSPSKGDLAPELDPERTARRYTQGGAAALSVLTDGPYFGGSLADLEVASAVTQVPVLRKDFIVDSVQIAEARIAGADAVLLIVAALDPSQLAQLHARTHDLGLAAVVEVHDDHELDLAIEVGARIIGINARDLSDFSEDLASSEELVARVPAEMICIAESAIRSRADAERMAAAGFDALLVGEALARASDPAGLLDALTTVPSRRGTPNDGALPIRRSRSCAS